MRPKAAVMDSESIGRGVGRSDGDKGRKDKTDGDGTGSVELGWINGPLVVRL